jgi:hypothetical protein
MAESEKITDEYVAKLSVEDNLSPAADAAAAKLDTVIKKAEGAGAALAGAGSDAEDAGEKVLAAASAFERVARRNDELTAAVYRLKSAQEELTRIQAQAAAAVAVGTVSQDAANRVLDEQVQKVERAAASLVTIREATEGAAEAQRLWQGQIADGSEALLGLQGQLTAFGAASQAAFSKQYGISAPTSEVDYNKRAADIAAYGAELDALQARLDPVFAATLKYRNELSALSSAIDTGVLPGLKEQSAALDKIVSDYDKATEAATGLKAAADAAAQAAQGKANAFAGVVAPTSDDDYAKRAADLSAVGSAADQLQAKLDPVFAATLRYRNELSALAEAIDTGVLPGMKEQSAALDRIVGDYEKATEAATGAKAAAEAAAQAAQARVNAFAGITQPTSEDDYAKRAADLNAVGAAADSLQASLDPVFAATLKYRTELSKLSEAIDTGVLPGLAEQSAALNKIVADYEKATEAATGMKATAAAAAQAFQSQANQFAGVIPPTSDEDYAKRAADLSAVGSAADQVQASLDPVFAATLRYRTELSKLSEAIDTGVLPGLKEQSAALNRIVADYEAATEAATGAKAAAEAAASTGQARANAFAGVTDPTSEEDYAKRAADLEAVGAAADQLQAKLSPVFAATLKYRTELSALAEAIDTGVLPSLAEQSAALNKIVADYEAATEAATGTKAAAEAAAQAAQAQVNAFAGVTAPTSTDDYNKRAADLAAVGSAADALQASLDPAFAATLKYRTELSALAEAIDTGVLPSLAEQSAALNKIVADYEKATEAATGARAAAEAAAEAGQAQANAFAGVTAPTSEADYAKRAADLEAVGEAADRLQASLDPVFAATLKYRTELSALSEAIDTGVLPGLAEQSAALDKIVSDYEAATEAATGMKAAAEAVAEAAQAQASAFAGVQAPTSDADYAKRAADIQAYGASLDALRAKFDPLFAMSMAYEKEFNLLNESVKNGALPVANYDAALDALNGRFAKAQKSAQDLATGHGQAAFAVRQLGVQTIQFFSSIEAGQSVFTAFIQQGHQVLDVALATGTGFGVIAQAAKQAWAAITTPTGLAITGLAVVATAIVGLGYAAEVAARKQEALRDQLSATTNDYVNLAEAVRAAGSEVAKSTPASTADATSAAQTFASAPLIDKSQQSLAKLTTTAQYLSAVLGKSLQDTANLMVEASADPTKVAVGLDTATKSLVGLDSVTLANIAHLQQLGDVTDANAKLMEVFGAAADRAEKELTPLQKAVIDLDAALSPAAQAHQKTFFESLGKAIDDMAAAAVEAIARTINALRDLQKWIDDHQNNPSAGSQGNAINSSAYQGDSIIDRFVAWVTGRAATNAAQTGQDVIDTQIQKLQAKYPSLFQGAPSGTSVLTDHTPGVAADSIGHGVMQIVPGTAAARGLPGGFIDQNAGQNIIAALNYMNSLFQQGRDAQGITQAYGGFSAGNTAGLTAKMGKLNAADIGKLPTDVSGGIAFIAQLYGWPDWLTKLALQTASVESGGTQFAARVSTPAKVDFPTGTPESIAAANAGASAMAGNLSDAQAAQLAKLITLQKEYTEARSQAVIHNDNAQVEQYNKLLEQNAVDINNVIHPTEQATKALQDQNTVASILYEADKQRAAGELAIARQRAQNPLHPISDDDAAKQIAAQLGALSAAYDLWVKKTQEATLEQTKLTVAWSGGAKAASDAAIQQQAYNIVAEKFGKAAADAGVGVAATAAIIRDNTKATEEAKAVQDSLATAQQIEITKVQTDTLLENGDARALLVQHMKDQNELASKSPQLLDQERAAMLAQKDVAAQLTQNLQNQQQTVNYLSQQFSSAFDTIGNSITQAFVQGSGAGVKFASVMQGVVTQLIQQFAHLAILNPILNNLFGKNDTTLGSVFNLFSGAGSTGGGAGSGLGTALQLVDLGNGVKGFVPVGGVGAISGMIGTQAVGTSGTLGGAFGGGTIGGLAGLYASGAGQGSSSSGGIGSLLSTGGSLFTIGKALFPDTFSAAGNAGGSMFSGLGESLGLTGPNGALTGITNFLNTPIIAPTAASGGILPGDAIIAANPGVTIGSLAGAASAGFAAGSLVGGFVQKSQNKVGYGPEIGAALGTAAGIAGVVLAPATFGTSLLIPALIGGVLGGSAGGLIGPHAPNAFSSTIINRNDQGLLTVGSTTSQRVNASGERSAAISDVQSINDLLTSKGLRVTSLEGVNTGAQYLQIGQNTPGGFQDPSKYSSIGAAFPSLRFSSSDDLTNRFIQGRLFQSPEELAGVTTSLSDFEKALKGTKAESDTMGIAFRALSGAANTDVQPALQKAATFITSIYPSLTAGQPGSLATNQSQVYAQYSDALNQAQQYGFGYDDLKAAQQKLYDRNNLVAKLATDTITSTQTSNFLTAQASISGSPQDALNAQLYQFDNLGAGSATQRQAFSDSLTAIWGDAFTTTQGYNDRMAEYDKATAEQRLAIQVAFNKQQQQNDIASNEQLLTLQARQGTTAAALSGDPTQIHTAALNSLNAQQAIERIGFQQSEQQTFGDQFYNTDSNYAAKWDALINSQANEMNILGQQINRENLQLQVNSVQQNENIDVRRVNAIAALYPTQVAPAAAYEAFDVQASQELQNFYLSMTQTYGNAYATTQEYGDKLNALVTAQGEERLVLEQTLNQKLRQQAIASWQQDITFTVRRDTARAAISGDPTAMGNASLSALYVQQVEEMQNLQEGLKQTYGDAYATTAEYYGKVGALQDAQTAEMQLAMQQLARAALERQVASQQQDWGFAVRSSNATANIIGSPEAKARAELFAFDVNAGSEQQNLYLSLTSTYGNAYALTKEYGDKMLALQNAQGLERIALQQQLDLQARQQQIASSQQDESFATRFENAQASVTGGQAALNQAARDALVVTQNDELDNLKISLVQTYGDAYQYTVDYGTKITALVKAQGEERLALQQQQNDALASQATSSITSLNQYARTLQTSAQSPLSPQAQFNLAKTQFDTQSGLASGGNFAAVQTLQTYADNYLNAAHTLYGSGTDYVTAFGRVITALAEVGGQTSDQLTASVLQTETRSQTAQLVEQLQELQDEVKQLRLQLLQGTTAPARVS